MRVLLDESLPRDLAPLVTGHDVSTVQAQGWAGLQNGALLRAARDADFAALVTADRNMEHQQNVARSGVALVVLRARSTRLADLRPLVPDLLAILSGVRAGTVTHVAG